MDQNCPLCLKHGRNFKLRVFQINLEEATILCENQECNFPFIEGVNLVVFKRDFRLMRDQQATLKALLEHQKNLKMARDKAFNDTGASAQNTLPPINYGSRSSHENKFSISLLEYEEKLLVNKYPDIESVFRNHSGTESTKIAGVPNQEGCQVINNSGVKERVNRTTESAVVNNTSTSGILSYNDVIEDRMSAIFNASSPLIMNNENVFKTNPSTSEVADDFFGHATANDSNDFFINGSGFSHFESTPCVLTGDSIFGSAVSVDSPVVSRNDTNPKSVNNTTNSSVNNFTNMDIVSGSSLSDTVALDVNETGVPVVYNTSTFEVNSDISSPVIANGANVLGSKSVSSIDAVFEDVNSDCHLSSKIQASVPQLIDQSNDPVITDDVSDTVKLLSGKDSNLSYSSNCSRLPIQSDAQTSDTTNHNVSDVDGVGDMVAKITCKSEDISNANNSIFVNNSSTCGVIDSLSDVEKQSNILEISAANTSAIKTYSEASNVNETGDPVVCNTTSFEVKGGIDSPKMASYTNVLKIESDSHADIVFEDMNSDSSLLNKKQACVPEIVNLSSDPVMDNPMTTEISASLNSLKVLSQSDAHSCINVSIESLDVTDAKEVGNMVAKITSISGDISDSNNCHASDQVTANNLYIPDTVDILGDVEKKEGNISEISDVTTEDMSVPKTLNSAFSPIRSGGNFDVKDANHPLVSSDLIASKILNDSRDLGVKNEFNFDVSDDRSSGVISDSDLTIIKGKGESKVNNTTNTRGTVNTSSLDIEYGTSGLGIICDSNIPAANEILDSASSLKIVSSLDGSKSIEADYVAITNEKNSETTNYLSNTNRGFGIETNTLITDCDSLSDTVNGAYVLTPSEKTISEIVKEVEHPVKSYVTNLEAVGASILGKNKVSDLDQKGIFLIPNNTTATEIFNNSVVPVIKETEDHVSSPVIANIHNVKPGNHVTDVSNFETVNKASDQVENGTIPVSMIDTANTSITNDDSLLNILNSSFSSLPSDAVISNIVEEANDPIISCNFMGEYSKHPTSGVLNLRDIGTPVADDNVVMEIIGSGVPVCDKATTSEVINNCRKILNNTRVVETLNDSIVCTVNEACFVNADAVGSAVVITSNVSTMETVNCSDNQGKSTFVVSEDNNPLLQLQIGTNNQKTSEIVNALEDFEEHSKSDTTVVVANVCNSISLKCVPEFLSLETRKHKIPLGDYLAKHEKSRETMNCVQADVDQSVTERLKTSSEIRKLVSEDGGYSANSNDVLSSQASELGLDNAQCSNEKNLYITNASRNTSTSVGIDKDCITAGCSSVNSDFANSQIEYICVLSENTTIPVGMINTNTIIVNDTSLSDGSNICDPTPSDKVVLEVVKNINPVTSGNLTVKDSKNPFECNINNLEDNRSSKTENENTVDFDISDTFISVPTNSIACGTTNITYCTEPPRDTSALKESTDKSSNCGGNIHKLKKFGEFVYTGNTVGKKKVKGKCKVHRRQRKKKSSC